MFGADRSYRDAVGRPRMSGDLEMPEVERVAVDRGHPVAIRRSSSPHCFSNAIPGGAPCVSTRCRLELVFVHHEDLMALACQQHRRRRARAPSSDHDRVVFIGRQICSLPSHCTTSARDSMPQSLPRAPEMRCRRESEIVHPAGLSSRHGSGQPASEGMTMRRISVWAVLLVALFVLPIWAADWITHSGDFQRTGWQKDETKISKDTVKNLQLLWKVKLETKQRSVYSLYGPMLLERAITDRGFKELAFVAGATRSVRG